MRWRFLRRKGPDCPATILFCYSDCETIGISEDEDVDEHEDEDPKLRSLGQCDAGFEANGCDVPLTITSLVVFALAAVRT